MAQLAFDFRAERWPSGRRHQIANLAYWVTGTEGSNPSLSAIQSVVFPYSLVTWAILIV